MAYSIFAGMSLSPKIQLDQRRKLLEAHYATVIPLDLLKKEQEKLTSGIVAIQRELDGDTADAALVEQHLTQAFDLLEDCYQLYLAAPDRLKNYSTKFLRAYPHQSSSG